MKSNKNVTMKDSTSENLKFPEHTKEKLNGIKYYYKVWFNIVKGQNSYIIDFYAGTGYCQIENTVSQISGSALLAVNLFKNDYNKKLVVFLINNDTEQCRLLKTNISDYIAKKNLQVSLGKEIKIIESDWKFVIDEILDSTTDGIRLFLFDPYGIKSIPWGNVELLIKNAKSEFEYKETGFEVLLNWGWHKIRRILGNYYKNRFSNKELVNLDKFFGSVNWKEIVDQYPNTIFSKDDDHQIEKLAYDLVKAYAKNFFKFFRYVKVHPIHYRKKRKEPHLKDKGKIMYFLIFASNYYEALNIIDKPFKESREAKIFCNLPKGQKTFSDWGISLKEIKVKDSTRRININEKIKRLEEELGENLFQKTKSIIKYLYNEKSHDFGCPDYVLFDEFKINEDIYIPYLKRNHIIDVRIKRTKKGNIINYYFLTHHILVDRSEYLFLNNEVFTHQNSVFDKITLE